jgi:hypothetical protein
MSDIKTATEMELRAMDVPWPSSIEELTSYINALADRQHDYGTCVYAMSMAALAAMQFMGHKLGTTGFQASCADMDILRRRRGMKHGFMVLDYEQLLYPQYNLSERVQEALKEALPNLAATARRFVAEKPYAHPDVIAHWNKISLLDGGSK